MNMRWKGRSEERCVSVSNAEYCTAEQSIIQLHEFESIFEESILPQLAKYPVIFGAKRFSTIFTTAILILSYYNKLLSHKTGWVSLQNFRPNSLYYLRLLLVYTMLLSSSRLYQTRDIYWETIVIRLTIQFTPAPCYFFFLIPKCFPPHNVLRRSQSMFFLCERNITWRVLKIQINLHERYWIGGQAMG